MTSDSTPVTESRCTVCPCCTGLGLHPLPLTDCCTCGSPYCSVPDTRPCDCCSGSGVLPFGFDLRRSDDPSECFDIDAYINANDLDPRNLLIP